MVPWRRAADGDAVPDRAGGTTPEPATSAAWMATIFPWRRAAEEGGDDLAKGLLGGLKLRGKPGAGWRPVSSSVLSGSDSLSGSTLG